MLAKRLSGNRAVVPSLAAAAAAAELLAEAEREAPIVPWPNLRGITLLVQSGRAWEVREVSEESDEDLGKLGSWDAALLVPAALGRGAGADRLKVRTKRREPAQATGGSTL